MSDATITNAALKQTGRLVSTFTLLADKISFCLTNHPKAKNYIRIPFKSETGLYEDFEVILRRVNGMLPEDMEKQKLKLEAQVKVMRSGIKDVLDVPRSMLQTESERQVHDMLCETLAKVAEMDK
jgi:hypothetical protein